MLIAYILEKKGRIWILVFALGCLSSAIYGYLADTLPFAVLEGIWFIVAFMKWKNSPSQKE
jgi:hypothetical protein